MVGEMAGAPPRRPHLNKFTFTCAILASMTSILVGLEAGTATTTAVNIFMSDYKISTRKTKTHFIVFSVASPMVSLVAGTASDLIGRRYTILFSLIIFFFGSLLTSLAQNFVFFEFGWVLVSIGIGFLHMVTPVYINELSPDSTRGFLTCFIEVFVNIGDLLGNVLGYSLSKAVPEHLSWRFILGLGTIPSFLLALSVLALPESPYWLVTRGRLREAKRVVDKISTAENEANLLFTDIKLAANGAESWKKLLLRPSPSIRRALIAAVGINFFRNAVGFEAVDLYSTTIFLKGGIKSEQNILFVTTAIGLIKISLVLVVGFLMDSIGRRPLLLTSVGGLIPCLAGLGLGLTVLDHWDKKLIWAIAFCFVMVIFCYAFFSIGLGPITWVYSAEIFPFWCRAHGASIGAAVHWGTRGVISLTFLSLYSTITVGGAFFFFAGMASVGLVFFYNLVPETLGKSLEEKDISCGEVDGGSDGVEQSKSGEDVAESECFSKVDEEISTFDSEAGRIWGTNTMDGRRLHKSATFPVCGQSTMLYKASIIMSKK